jgi:hypothetical protein
MNPVRATCARNGGWPTGAAKRFLLLEIAEETEAKPGTGGGPRGKVFAFLPRPGPIHYQEDISSL